MALLAFVMSFWDALAHLVAVEMNQSFVRLHEGSFLWHWERTVGKAGWPQPCNPDLLKNAWGTG